MSEQASVERVRERELPMKKGLLCHAPTAERGDEESAQKESQGVEGR